MKNTKMALLGVGLTLFAAGLIAVWVKICYHISDGADWGFVLALGGLIVPYVAFAIYKDLTA